MTREEAIRELEEDKAMYMPREWIEELDRDTPDGRLITALEVAIKSLEAWEKIRKIYDEKAHNVKVRYIHDLQIWADARDIIDKHLSGVSE